MYPTTSTAGTMKGRSHGALVWLGLATLLTGGMAVRSAAAAPTGQAKDPVTVVTAFDTAFNRNDHSGALAVLDPAFTHVTDPNKPGAHVQTAAEFLKEPLPQVKTANLHQTGADTAEADITLSHGTIPPVAHPFTLHAIYTISNGRILRIVDYLSPQTARDLATLGPPPGAPAAMPNTGASGSNMGLWLLLLGVLGVLAGTVVRRASLLRH